VSWESSAEYYRLVNEFVRDRLGGLHSAPCVLVSVDFAEIERLQATGDWDKAAPAVAQTRRRLGTSQCEECAAASDAAPGGVR
jgi:aspartate racemase